MIGSFLALFVPFALWAGNASMGVDANHTIDAIDPRVYWSKPPWAMTRRR